MSAPPTRSTGGNSRNESLRLQLQRSSCEPGERIDARSSA